MKILLIHPKMGHGPVTDKDRGKLRSKLFTNPMMTLPAVASCIPSQYTVRLLHEDYEDVNYSQDCDLVGISCFTMYALRAYGIADEFRRRGVPVVLGGYHPTALPEEAKQHADSVVMGEAELCFPHLLEDLEQDKLKSFYRSELWARPEQIPPLRRDLLSIQPLVDGIRATRGCPHGCQYCSITCFYNHTFRKRPIMNVINEMKSIPRKLLLIHDANLTADVNYTKALFKEMIKEKVNKKWLGNGNIYVLGTDEQLLRLARKAGCIGWTTGIESISQESLNGVNKSANNVQKYRHWIKTIKKHDMAVFGLIMFGFDHDYPDVFEKTSEALREWDIDTGEFNIFTPLPGTPLFNQMENEGRILTKDWSQYTQTRVVFQPKHMTPQELNDGFQDVVREFHHPLKMIKRTVRLARVSFSPSTMLLIPAIDYSHRIWYGREFDL